MKRSKRGSAVIPFVADDVMATERRVVEIFTVEPCEIYSLVLDATTCDSFNIEDILVDRRTVSLKNGTPCLASVYSSARLCTPSEKFLFGLTSRVEIRVRNITGAMRTLRGAFVGRLL